MLINLRNALMAGRRLPYDAEVEYLESSGTQWIDTGAPLNLQHSIRCVFHEIDTSTYYPGVVSGRGSPVHLRTYTILSPRFDYWNGSDVSPSANVLSLTRGIYTDFKTEVSTSDNRLYRYVNGAKSYTSLQSGFTPNNIWLFRDRANTDLFVGRLYCYQELDGSTLVRDYIPVRKGTVGYLYDRVSGKLFGNAGSGDFVVGQDVVPVEYIESHGTEYINTDKSVDLPMHLEADINFTNPSAGTKVQTLVGGYNASLTNQRFWVTSLPQGKINCGLLTNSISTNLVPANRKVRLVVDFENGRQVATIDGVQYTSASQSTTNYWFRDWKLRIFQSFGTRVDSAPLQAITNRIDIDIGASQALRLLPVRVGTDATSWEGAMMDALTRRIYRNAGTGAFGYGNDLKYPIPAE